MTDHVGRQFGNYQLVKLLGQGGFSKVYLGKHRYLNSYAALKILHATINAEDEHKFRAEAQALVDLRHKRPGLALQWSPLTNASVKQDITLYQRHRIVVAGDARSRSGTAIYHIAPF